MSHQIKSVARLIGNSYAHVQHGVDVAIEWGFTKMKEQEKTATKSVAKTPAGKVEKVGRGILGVIGAAGDAYFRTYSELKRKTK